MSKIGRGYPELYFSDNSIKDDDLSLQIGRIHTLNSDFISAAKQPAYHWTVVSLGMKKQIT